MRNCILLPVKLNFTSRRYYINKRLILAIRNRKQIARRAKITGVQEKSGPEKWKLTETSVCYSDEYATGITDI